MTEISGSLGRDRSGSAWRKQERSRRAKVAYGSWLCENAKALDRDRRSYSSKAALVVHRASGFNLEIELKNIILRRVSIFEFLHSQGHLQTFPAGQAMSALPPKAEVGYPGCHVC